MLFEEISNVFPTKSTVDHISIFVHGRHILLNIVRTGSQRCHIWFQIDREGFGVLYTLSQFLLTSLATLLFLSETASSHLSEADERDRRASLYSLFLFIDSLGYQLKRRRQAYMLELAQFQLALDIFFEACPQIYILIRVVRIFNSVNWDVLVLQGYLIVKRAFLFFYMQSLGWVFIISKIIFVWGSKVVVCNFDVWCPSQTLWRLNTDQAIDFSYDSRRFITIIK